jgi:hypothetical protein
MGEAGRQRVLAEWNYEHQFQPVINLLEGEIAQLSMEARRERAMEARG